jgi:DNA-binding MarR family transcriptional regulator
MTATPKPDQARGSDPDMRLIIFVAHALSQPLRLAGETEASLSSYAVFWCVAAREGRTQVEVAKDTGLSAKTVSRVVSHLGDSRNGLGWIRQVADDGDRRLRRLFLSRKGKSVLSRMLKDLKNCGGLAAKA